MNKIGAKEYKFIYLRHEEYIPNKKYIEYCLLYFPMFPSNHPLCKSNINKFRILALPIYDECFNLGVKWHRTNKK